MFRFSAQCFTPTVMTSLTIVQRELLGHVGDVTACRFFPSGTVVLSVSLARVHQSSMLCVSLSPLGSNNSP